MTFFTNVWNILRNFKVTSLTLEGESLKPSILKNHAPKQNGRGGKTGHHENWYVILSTLGSALLQLKSHVAPKNNFYYLLL